MESEIQQSEIFSNHMEETNNMDIVEESYNTQNTPFNNFNKRMNMDTWYYAKRCFLSLIENLAKQILSIPDKLYMELVNFLDNADKFGKNITTQIVDTHSSENSEKFTVSSEARLLKKMLLRLKDSDSK